MGSKTFLDTCVFLYATLADQQLCVPAVAALEAGGVTSVQVLCEFTAIARDKLGRSWHEVHEALSIIDIVCPRPLPLTWSTFGIAVEMVQQDGLPLQDALIAASAVQAGCSVLLSGMAADGRVIADQLTIRNPFRQSWFSRPDIPIKPC